ncbi:MAG: HAD-IA family hydrolase [Deltaproteobacteria bacterium]|nr:HAD-IA family hydrolase [Deltaproteobacteria bacterium]
MATRPFDLIIFDWDGTLIDSIGTIVACTLAALDDLSLGPMPEESIRDTIGLGLEETMEKLMPDADADLRNRLRQAYFHHWVETYHGRPILFEGVDQLLVGLNREDYLLAVATGKSRRGLERDMDRVGQRQHFVTTRTVDEAASKPHPQMINDILDELGVQPERALMVGDTTYDMAMAKEAGASRLGVLTGSHSCEQLETYQPLACLSTALDIPGWLAGLAGGRPSFG